MVKPIGGQANRVKIVRVKKNGDFIDEFVSPGGTRDEGLECDPASFGVLALLSRDFDGDFISAVEIEEGSCACPGCVLEPLCVETVNPHGRNIPRAPGKGGQGQNQDGYYLLSSANVCGGPTNSLFVRDTETGTIFGPFPPGTRIKYTEANGRTPGSRPQGGNNGNGKGRALAVDWHIWGQGDAEVFALDEAGAETEAVSCLVPPAPK
jgi:hypothetical protein